jgi:nitrogen-specific signal transduction histidine kinase
MMKNSISSNRDYKDEKNIYIVGQWKWDLKKDSIDLSDDVFRILGFKKENAIDNSHFFMNLIHSQNSDLFQILFSNITSNKAPFVQNHHIINKDGNSKFITIVGIPRFSSTGDIEEISGTILDMSSFSQFEIKYANFWEESIDGFVLYDSNLNFVDANKSLMSDFFPDLSKKDLIGKNITELVPGIEETERFNLYKHVLETGHPLILDEITTNEKFGPRTLLAKAFRCNENLGLIFSDISDLKKNERELEEYKDHLEELLLIRNNQLLDLGKFPSENPAPVLRLSKGKILFANERAKKIFLLNEKKSLPEIIQKATNQALLKDKVKTIEIDRKSHKYLLTIIPIKSSEYVNIYGTDITKLKATEKKFEKFVSNIIHQLRTPLSVIQMSLKYLERNRERINSELEKKIFNGVYRNLKSIDDLIKDLITFTQLNDSSINLNIERFSLSNEISESIESMEPLAKEKNIKIVDNINKNIELNADKNKIKQVFQILIDNAIKYSKRDSEIIVNSNFNRLSEKNVNELIIEFVDDGIGINDEDLPHLFERFYRSKRVAHIEGIGLGLSIAKTIIQMHGGKIHAKRNLDRGTTFSIVLPNSRIS